MPDALPSQVDVSNYRKQRDAGTVKVLKPIAKSENFVVMVTTYDPLTGREGAPKLANMNAGTILEARNFVAARRAELDSMSAELDALEADMAKL